LYAIPPPNPAAAIATAAAIFTGPRPGARCQGHLANGYLSGSEIAQPGEEHLRAIVVVISNELSMQLLLNIVSGAIPGSLNCKSRIGVAKWLKKAHFTRHL
jgi:hypothetical protein